MPIRRKARMGDFLRVCDRTGFTRYASETTKEWDQTIVWDRVYETRQPQDLLRGFPDDGSVKDPRPPGIATFIGPLVTEVNAAQAPGDTELTVRDNTRMLSGDRVSIMLDNTDAFITTLSTVNVDGVTITIDDPLPGATSAGKKITDLTAIAAPDLG